MCGASSLVGRGTKQREKYLVEARVALSEVEARVARVEKLLSEVEVRVIEAKMKVANAEARALAVEEVLGEAMK